MSRRWIESGGEGNTTAQYLTQNSMTPDSRRKKGDPRVPFVRICAYFFSVAIDSCRYCTIWLGQGVHAATVIV